MGVAALSLDFSAPPTLTMQRPVRMEYAGEAAALSRPAMDWLHDANHRLIQLMSLPIGWDGHYGRPVTWTAGSYALQVLQAIMKPHVPLAAIMPLSSGGVQLEWHRKGWDLEIEIVRPSELHVYTHQLASGREEEFSVAYDLSRLAEVIAHIQD